MSEIDVVLSVEGLTKSYGAQRPALCGVSFELRAGEVLCVVGENGAGKSTLIKILSGAVGADSGTIALGGTTRSQLRPHEAMALGVATIYQDVELIDSLTVADNIFLGAERRSGGGLIVDSRAQESEARRLLEMLHIDIRASALVEELSAAQKQNLQIVKALHQDAKILIMDEPTSSLGFEEKRSLMALVKDLRSRGIAIIYISHYLEEVFEIGDSILILKDGELVGVWGREAVDVDFVIRSMVGRGRIPLLRPGACRDRRHQDRSEGHALARGRRGRVLRREGRGDLRDRRPDRLGAERARRASSTACTGGRPASSSLAGRRITPRDPADAIRKGVRLITEDRKKYAMFGPQGGRGERGDSPMGSSPVGRSSPWPRRRGSRMA